MSLGQFMASARGAVRVRGFARIVSIWMGYYQVAMVTGIEKWAFRKNDLGDRLGGISAARRAYSASSPSKSVVPMRTIVAPSSIATSKSPDMPIDRWGNVSPSTSHSSRNRSRS